MALRPDEGRFPDRLPVLGQAEDGLFHLDDRTAGFAFMCRPMAAGDDKAAARINVLLNADWPADTLVQFALFASPDISRQSGEISAARFGQRDPLLARMIDERIALFEEGTMRPVERESGLRVRDCVLAVTVKVPIDGDAPSASERRRLVQLRNSFRQSLEGVGLAPRTLSDTHWVRLMNTLLCQGRQASWRRARELHADGERPLRDQVLDPGQEIRVERNGVTLGERKARVLSFKRLPRHAVFGQAMSYLGDLRSGSRGIRENVLISGVLHFPDHMKARNRMETKRQWAVNQAYGPMLKFVPMLARKKRGFDTLFEALDEGERLVHLYLGMTIFADDDEAAAGAVSNARAYLGELGFTAMEDHFFTLPLFLQMLPLCADRKLVQDSFRYRTMGTRHAIALLPLFGDWRGTGSAALNFVSRNGQLMHMSLFDSESNYNCCVAAQSGSGKSFLTNEIIASYLSMGGKCWVVDVGRSYVKQCEFYGGEFIEFGPESRVSLNPFRLVRNYEEEVDALAGLVAAMAAPTRPLDDFQSAHLKRVMREVWEDKGSEMAVDDIAHTLSGANDRRVRDIGEQLYPFTARGEYGRYFTGENSVAFGNRFTVLELEELKGRKHLQQVVLLQLIYQIQQDMYLGDIGQRKIVIIDEAWDLLTQGDVARFIEHGYRRFRKYGGSAITVTQSVSDLHASPAGRAIVENSANLYLLAQKADAVDALEGEKRLPVSAFGYDMLKTVHTVPGAYSEILFVTGHGAGIGRLMVDPFRMLLYSTHPEDVAAIQARRAGGLNVTEAIEEVLRERGQR